MDGWIVSPHDSAIVLHYVSKNGATFIFAITLANVDRF